jgi:hypothetical protein
MVERLRDGAPEDGGVSRTEVDSGGVKASATSTAHLKQNQNAVGHREDLAEVHALSKRKLQS